MAKLPAFQFYPGDWMKDPALRACSIGARGLWMDMLCLMFESDFRGHLQHSTGKPVSCEQLARMTGCTPDDVDRLLQELEESGVFSRTPEGVIYSRRMTRDEGFRAVRAEGGKLGASHGSKGGRPVKTAKADTGTPQNHSRKPLAHPLSKPLDEPLTHPLSKPLEGGQNNPPSSSSSSSSSDEENSPSESSGADRPAGGSSEPKKVRKTPDTAHHRCIDFFCTSWRTRYGHAYPFNGGKDGDSIRWVLCQIGEDEAAFRRIATRYLADGEEFVVKSRHTIGLLRSQLARWLTDPPAPGPTIYRPASGKRTSADVLAEHRAKREAAERAAQQQEVTGT